MKKYFLLLSIVATIALGAFSVSAQCDPNTQSPIKCSYYNEGYQDGSNDRQSGQNSDYRRYKNKYERKYEDFFRDGYNAGYNSNLGTGPIPVSNEYTAYDRGYWLGGSDIRGNLSRSYKRYQTQYDRKFESYFKLGYEDGYAFRDRKYPSPTGPVYPPKPTYPIDPIDPIYPNPGVGYGTATWNGRVDDRANIIIRGNQIYAENVSGNGVQTSYQNMSGSLGRRSATINVRKADGRGNVNVIQQPNRSNNFTAIVQIADTKGGSGDYRLEITWQGSANNIEEPYRPGSITWRGRVDQTVRISVAGTDVQTEDIAGTGLSNVDFSINGYLANRPGSVSVRKKKGRGTVTVLEQPSRFNDYMAVIQIFDPNGGADNYELEITW